MPRLIIDVPDQLALARLVQAMNRAGLSVSYRDGVYRTKFRQRPKAAEVVDLYARRQQATSGEDALLEALT